MDQQDMKRTFMESAVRVVARDGLERATTKSIAAEAGLNEAYIYKCFSSKDELLAEALHWEDENFAALLLETLPVMYISGLAWRDRAFLLWKRSWKFILEKKTDLLFYLRYYSSANCQIYAYEKHKKCFHGLIMKIKDIFKPDTNVEMLGHQIFDTMLAFASRVINGEMENNEETTEWVFKQIYSFVAPSIKADPLEGKGKEAT